MELVTILAVGVVGFLLMQCELSRREPHEERIGVTEATDGRPAAVEYEIHQNGGTYHAHRDLYPTTVYDLCPHCGGKVVVAQEEEAWMGGHSTFIALSYACQNCGHEEENNFGIEGMRQQEGPLVADDDTPEPGLSAALVLLGAIAVAGLVLVVTSFVTANMSWRIVGAGCVLLGVAYLGVVFSKDH